MISEVDDNMSGSIDFGEFLRVCVSVFFRRRCVAVAVLLLAFVLCCLWLLLCGWCFAGQLAVGLPAV